jgi:oxygen-independent coproporphyrinogen-3 oxidase
VRARHLYIHVPFCARRCSYCDFSIAVRRETPVAEFVDDVRRELELRVEELDGAGLHTVYLGGGTPSRLGGEGIAALLSVVRARNPIAADAEVTIEANPDDVTLEDAAAWRAAGVTRVSLGAQTFHDPALAWMHRLHDAAAIGTAIERIVGAGIANWSIDLIFNLPESLGRDWSDDLARALAFGPPHVSLYGLTIEPHTPLGRWRDRGQVVEGTEERYAHEFLLAHRTLSEAGYEHYEVSNFSRSGEQARHNSAYWSLAPYMGIGPAAHGYDGQVRRWNASAWVDWRRRLQAGDDPVEGSERLTAANREAEAVYLGLRTRCGLEERPGEAALLDDWVRVGWAERADGRVRLTAEGWLRLDSLAATLTAARSR